MTAKRAYQTILLDPPWPEHGGGQSKRGADRHYSLLRLSDIGKTILRSGVFHPDPSGCHLWLWTTKSHLPAGLALIEELGFRYVSMAVWVKMIDDVPDPQNGQSLSSIDVARAYLQIGLGQYLRGSHETLLFATLGQAMVPSPADRGPDVIFAERTVHSRKPVEAYELIERVSPGPRLEMFARSSRPGWDAWGDEAPSAVDQQQGESTCA